jgi:hypothetical protein
MHTHQERQTFIATIATFPDDMSALVAGLTDEQLTTPYLAGEWSVAQNIHHLADSHMNSFIRLKLMLTEDRPPLKGYNADAWAVLPDASDADIATSLMILTGLHRRWVKLWQSVQADQWERSGIHSERGEVILDELLKMYANHCKAHIDQVTRTLQAGGISR